MAHKTTTHLTPAQRTLLAEIARAHLGFETLKTRNSDSLDFRDVNCASVEDALAAAFAAGRASR